MKATDFGAVRLGWKIRSWQLPLYSCIRRVLQPIQRIPLSMSLPSIKSPDAATPTSQADLCSNAKMDYKHKFDKVRNLGFHLLE